MFTDRPTRQVPPIVHEPSAPVACSAPQHGAKGGLRSPPRRRLPLFDAMTRWRADRALQQLEGAASGDDDRRVACASSALSDR